MLPTSARPRFTFTLGSPVARGAAEKPAARERYEGDIS